MTNKQLAKKIARKLFTAGNGERAKALQLHRNHNSVVGYLGGWAEKPMADIILKILDAAKPSGDTKRLDWLSKQRYLPSRHRMYGMPPYKSLRGAIDAAMKHTKGKK